MVSVFNRGYFFLLSRILPEGRGVVDFSFFSRPRANRVVMRFVHRAKTLAHRSDRRCHHSISQFCAVKMFICIFITLSILPRVRVSLIPRVSVPYRSGGCIGVRITWSLVRRVLRKSQNYLLCRVWPCRLPLTPRQLTCCIVSPMFTTILSNCK